MRASNDRKALQGYVDHLTLLFNQTISGGRIGVVYWDRDSKESLVACCVGKRILPLKLRPRGWLHFRQYLHTKSQKNIVGYSRYAYSLSDDPDDEDEWAFRYEYHLNPPNGVPHAHLHVNANWHCSSLSTNPLKEIHFPTERISIEKVIAHLIIEYGVKPKRRDWLEFLAGSHSEFAGLRVDPPMFP